MKTELLIDSSIEEVVIHYAKNTLIAGGDEVVCSPLEAKKVHDICRADFLTITPGIRFDNNDSSDQNRISTPIKAKAMGSDYIVVGRPIINADDPVAVYENCVLEFVD